MCSGTGVSQRIVGNFKADIFKNTYQRLLLKKLLLLLSLHKNGKEKPWRELTYVATWTVI